MVQIIGICGKTCSGKTSLAKKISDNIPGTIIINQDDFYKNIGPDQNPQKYNFDVPSAINFDEIINVLCKLKSGKSAEIPQYDMIKYKRKLITKTVTPTNLVIIEGILIFNDKCVRELLDIKIYVEANAETCLLRRLKRDMSNGRSFDDISERYTRDIIKCNYDYIEPSKKYANAIVNNNNIDNTIGFGFIIDSVKAKLV